MASCVKAARGPSETYDNDAKNLWRGWVWSFIAGATSDRALLPGHQFITTNEDGSLRQSRSGNVLFMPSIEGHEVREAMKRGLTMTQCHVVDESAAVVATLQRTFPGIVTYGVPVERACLRISKAGIPLLAANLDFCGNISRPLLRAVARCWDSGALDNAMVFITVLRGREDDIERRLMPLPLEVRRAFDSYPVDKWWLSPDGLKASETDMWRIWTLVQASNRLRDWHVARAYVSPNGQSFLTVAFNPKEDAA